MKCLSLWQPWATLMITGNKKIETRCWRTTYRGPLAIHAAKKWNRELRELCFQEPFVDALESVKPNEGGLFYEDDLVKTFPRGVIIGYVDLIDCVLMTPERIPLVDSREHEFGDYQPGRFMWITKSAVKLSEPIPYRGQQGLFEIDCIQKANEQARKVRELKES